MTRRYKITLAYDGTNFAGFQVQPNQRTVQSVLEAAVNKMSKNSDYITIYGSGRTDAGVHALGQVVHFDFPHDIPAEGMLKGLNSMLPLDCEVVGCEIVPNDFHARFTTHGKRYMYRVSRGRFTNPFKRFYTGHYKYPLDIEKSRKPCPIWWERMIFQALLLPAAKRKITFARFMRQPSEKTRKTTKSSLNFAATASCTTRSESWWQRCLKSATANARCMIF